MTRYVVPAVGIVPVLIGVIWVLQGMNVIGGSFMSGSQGWLVNGLIAALDGIGLLVFAARVRRRS